jgi:hypothetical protein
MTDDVRRLAAQFFNRTWELIEQSGRTAEDDRQMLISAMASRGLWSEVGGHEQLTTGDWQVSHVAALTGHADLALDFAAAAFERAAGSDLPLWLQASTCEGLARAHAAAGHAAERDAWVLKTRELLLQVDDPGDRALIEGQLATVDGQ